MIYPRETAVPREIHAERSEWIATKPPIAYGLDSGLHRQLAARQESGTLNSDEVVTATCGYIEDGDDWEPWSCDDATTCKTIAASNFGCFPTVYTACYASTEWDSVTALENRALYCTESTWTECVTGYKTFEDGVITGYICGIPELAGDNSVVDNTLEAETTTATSTTTSETVTSSSAAPTETGGGGSSTPVGAIVGGVVGGVAVLALVAFGIWFMLYKKKKATRNTESEVTAQVQNPPMNPPMTYNTPAPYSPKPPTYQSMSPVSPPSDAQSGFIQQGFFPPQPTPPVTKQETAPQPTATEMPTENYRTSGPPVELQ